MVRKVRKAMAFLLAFALVFSMVRTDQLSVRAETAAETEASQEESVSVQSEEKENEASEEEGDSTPNSEESPEVPEGSVDDGTGDPAGNTDIADGTGSGNNGSQNGNEPTTPPVSSEDEEESSTAAADPTAPTTPSTSEAVSEEVTSEVNTEETSTEESAEETSEEVSTEETSEAETETETETATEGETGEESEEWIDYEPQQQPDGIKVWARVKAGAFSEDVKMFAEELGGEEEAKAGEALEEEGVEFDGFLALDIRFENEEGEEIEPEEGSVQVQIEVDAKKLPEEVEADSLQVQHLNESDGEVKVESVADSVGVTGGEVKVEAQAVKAEFEVESFSKFTITWENTTGDFERQDKSLTIKYVDEDGNEIFPEELKTIIEDLSDEELSGIVGKEIPVSDYEYEITGYEFQDARWNNMQGDSVTAVKVKKQVQQGIFGWEWTSYILQYQSSGKWIDNSIKKPTLLMVYKETGVPVPDEPSDLVPEHKKYVKDNNDGTYDLTLTVEGDVDTTTSKAKLDVIFVLDGSSSMGNSMGWYNRMYYAKEAIKTLTSSLADNEDILPRFALVTFDGVEDGWFGQPYDDADTICSWTYNAQELNNSVEDVRVPRSAGTNYEAGLYEANKLLELVRPDAVKVVIFVSDGNPGYYYQEQGYTQGTGNPGTGYNETAMKHAQNILKGMNINYFYSVGVGSDEDQYGRLKDLNEGANENTETGYAAGTDEDALKKAFDDIEAEITSYRFSEVTIDDTLSENVELAADALPYIEIRDGSGNIKARGYGSVLFTSGEGEDTQSATATATAANGKIRLSFNPSTYELEDGWTYSVTAIIEPTDKAYENYVTAPDTGDEGTDHPDTKADNYISSGKPGVYTNRTATLYYTYNNEDKNTPYAKPVIPIVLGKLAITKEIVGLTNDPSDNNDLYDQALKKISFQVLLDGKQVGQSIQGTELKESGDGTLFYIVDNLIPGKTYTITETAETVDGYTLEPDSNERTVTVSETEIGEASFTNTYEPTDKTLTIKKIVTGNMGNTNPDHQFTFHLELTKDGEAYTEPLKYADGTKELTVTETKDYYEFSLPANGQISLKVPAGADYTITEIDAEKLGYEVSWQVGDGTGTSWNENNNSCNGTLDVDKTITFKNELEIAPPTGIRDNVIPFSMMLLTAAAGTVWFGLFGRRKRSA